MNYSNFKIPFSLQNKITPFVVALIWLAMLVLGPMGGMSFAGAKKNRIKFSTLAPEGSSWMKQMRQLADALMERLASGRFRNLNMSLIQKGSGEYEVWGFEVEIDCSHYEKIDSMGESLPRAIIEACCEALSD